MANFGNVRRTDDGISDSNPLNSTFLDLKCLFYIWFCGRLCSTAKFSAMSVITYNQSSVKMLIVSLCEKHWVLTSTTLVVSYQYTISLLMTLIYFKGTLPQQLFQCLVIVCFTFNIIPLHPLDPLFFFIFYTISFTFNARRWLFRQLTTVYMYNCIRLL